MARKTSDIAMLLSSRSKSRSRGGKGNGIGARLVGLVDQLLGRSSRSTRGGRSNSFPTGVFLIAVLVAFGGGFFVRDRLGDGGAGPGPDPLSTSGREPTFFNEAETSPLTSRAYVVAIYSDLDGQRGFEQANVLSNFLQNKGLQRTRPYRWPLLEGGETWVTAVYVDGASEEQAVAQRLHEVAAITDDPWFQAVKNQSPNDWPVAIDVPMQ